MCVDRVGLFLVAGLSDDMRADYRVMQDLAVHTRLGPGDRADRYMAFRKSMETYVASFYVLPKSWH